MRELPARITECAGRWRLTLGGPYEGSSVSIVFPATLRDGSGAVLKLQYPHSESTLEAEALRQWNGNGAVRLLDHDPEHHALLLERCEPGNPLSGSPWAEALDIFARLLPKLWIEAGAPFTSLADEAAGWLRQLPDDWERCGRPFERALLDDALEVLERFRVRQGVQVLVHQDLHGDNVLRASREPWLVIDPKPLAGEREFSLAPIIRSYEFGHTRDQVLARLDTLVERLALDRERVRLWAMAQTLAWAIDANGANERHVATAQWLWRA